MALDTDPNSPNYGKDVDTDFAQVAAQYGVPVLATGPDQLSPQGASAEATRLSTPFGQAQQALGTFNAVPDLTSKAIADLDAWRVKTFRDVGATTSPLVTAPALTTPPKVQAAQPVGTTTSDNTGFTPVIGSEFGEVDRPSRGGYTEAGWDRGAWGDDLTGNNNQGVALPPTLLAKYGYTGQKGFNQQFNSQYEVQVRNPQTGLVTTAPLKDLGPGKSTGAQIDLLAGTRGAVGLGSNFKGNVEMRVVPKGTGVASGQTATGQTTDGQGSDDITGPIYIHPIDPTTLKQPSPVPGQQLSTDELTTWARAQTDQYAAALAKAGTPMTGDEYKQTFGGFFGSGQKINMGILPERLPADQISSLEALDEGNKQIDNVVKLLDDFRKAHPQWIPGTKVALDPTMKASNEYKAFDAARSLAMMPLARGVGGMTSRVSDVDLQTIKDALPNEYDTPEQAQAKATILKQQALDMMDKKLQYFQAANYDVSRFNPLYAKAKAEFNASPTQAQQDNTGRTAAQKTAYQQTRANRVAALTRPAPLLPPQPPKPNAQPNIFEPPAASDILP
jgi:hypothetical protein